MKFIEKSPKKIMQTPIKDGVKIKSIMQVVIPGQMQATTVMVGLGNDNRIYEWAGEKGCFMFNHYE